MKMKTHLILKSILILCFIFVHVSMINADVGIYTPIGKPQITDLSYSLKGVDENGLDLTVKNIGEESGSFQLAVSCNNNWEVYSYGGYTSNFQLASGDTKNVRIPLSCNGGDSCYTSVNCEVSVEDTYGSFLTGQDLKDTRKIGFQAQHPNYCSSSYQTCESGKRQCQFSEGGTTQKIIEKCNQYCNKMEIEKTCDYKCIYKNGEPICLSLAEEKSMQSKATWETMGIIVLVVLIIFGIVMLLRRKKK